VLPNDEYDVSARHVTASASARRLRAPQSWQASWQFDEHRHYRIGSGLALDDRATELRKGNAMSHSILVCVAVSLVVSACASSPPPKDRMAWAEATVREAKAAGAERVPSANAQLEYAKSEIRRARAFARADDNDRAESMLRRAAADAQLAVALVREAQAHDQTQSPTNSIE
jgi:hypothetical protein